jgi:hypothetical protein
MGFTKNKMKTVLVFLDGEYIFIYFLFDSSGVITKKTLSTILDMFLEITRYLHDMTNEFRQTFTKTSL